VPYWKSICTGRTASAVPGVLAAICSVAPSFGCTEITSSFGGGGASRLRNGWCGTGLKTIAISVARSGRRLPVRR